ncbi:MAG: polymerase sigma-B factor, partial [Thermoleophilaceae bacterium]|nr:polymerase sigma-B factor [Thermoleophilaceae bacterium]
MNATARAAAPPGAPDLTLVTLSPQRREEQRLFLRYHRDGDVAARDELIRRCLPLARRLASRYHRSSEPLDDLLQVASIGLNKAVDRFDPTRGIAFSSFAVPSILGELKRHFRDHGWAARVPRPVQERVLKMHAATERLHRELGRPPTPSEIAVSIGENVEDVIEAQEAASAYDSISLDAPLGTGDDGSAATYADLVGEVDGRLELVEYRSVVDATIRALPERERTVLAMRFEQDMTQSEIAAQVGVSQMHVSR